MAVTFDKTVKKVTFIDPSTGKSFQIGPAGDTAVSFDHTVRPVTVINSSTGNNVDFVAEGLATKVVSAYTASAVHFAGAGTRLTNAAVSVTDSAVFSQSFWVKIADASPFGTLWAVDPAVQANICQISGFQLQTALSSNDFSNRLGINNGASGFSSAWHHVLVSLDTSTAVGKMYLDDIDVSILLPAGIAFVPNFNGKQVDIGDDTYGEGFTGDMADMRLMVGTSLLVAGDIPVAKRRLFIDGSGKPVDPATATATLGTPTVLFSGDSTAFGTNQGSGGAFTLIGSLTNASTHP